MINDETYRQSESYKCNKKNSKRNGKKAQFIINFGGWTIEKLSQIGNIYSGILAVSAFLAFCSSERLIKVLDFFYSVCSMCAAFCLLLMKAFWNI